MLFNCAVFDMDGTLVDSAALWIEAKLDVLQRRGIAYTQADVAQLASLELEGSADYLQQHFLPQLTTGQLCQELLDYADHFYAHTAALEPGAKELLEQLNAMGIPCCLATATPKERFEPLLRRLGVLRLLQHFVTTYDVGKSKHYADIFVEAARRGGGTPATTVVFEDTCYSIKAAKEAGFCVVTLRQPSTNGGPQYTALCDLLLDDFTQLPADFLA